jgi:hypothetical protein
LAEGHVAYTEYKRNKFHKFRHFFVTVVADIIAVAGVISFTGIHDTVPGIPALAVPHCCYWHHYRCSRYRCCQRHITGFPTVSDIPTVAGIPTVVVFAAAVDPVVAVGVPGVLLMIVSLLLVVSLLFWYCSRRPSSCWNFF